MGVVTTVSSLLLTLPGATALTDETHGLDAHGVAWHYGNPLAEQRTAHDGTVFVDRSQRAVLEISGADAGSFLNTVTSQKLDDAADGFSASALDLDIQGRILHHADVTKVGERFYLDVPASQADSLETFLSRMVFWSQVEITRPKLAIITVLGDADLPESVLEAAAFARRRDWPEMTRRDLAVNSDALNEIADTLINNGITPAGLMAFTAERVRAVEPELGIDLDNKSIPHEAPTLIGRGDHVGAVHLDKGCYRGQETVARVENLGRSPRLLVLVHLDGSAPGDPAPGDSVMVNGRTVGRLGTVVHDCDYGPIALAVIKRSALNSPQLSVRTEQGWDVSAAVDKDSLPTDEGEKAGRAAVEKLRSQR